MDPERQAGLDKLFQDLFIAPVRQGNFIKIVINGPNSFVVKTIIVIPISGILINQIVLDSHYNLISGLLLRLMCLD